MFYFFFAYKELKKRKQGIGLFLSKWNFGNICAGIMAKS
jgi:threonine synthase